ncbi:MAG: NAD(P)-dependent oxidoreductase [Lachnospiraceae bacterium]|nr:NAD(P)-dependent oxidoreductase [Lachnospiraceae bacterium]
MIKRAIVTGATGLTGNALVRYLSDKGIEVAAVARRNSSRISSIPRRDNVKIIECNIDEYHNADSLFKDEYDAFFHLAWDGSLGNNKVDNRYNVELQMNNLNCFVQAVELSNRIGCKKFIATGTQAEYGPVNGVIDENTPLKPTTAYGSAKVCAHNMSDILCDRYGIALIWCRLFSIYGPHDGAMSLVDTAIKELVCNNKSIEYTSGLQKWNYLYSFDAAKALYLLAEKTDKSDTFCVASKESRPLKEYINIIHEVSKTGIIPELGKKQSNSPVSMDVNIDKLVNAAGFCEDYSFEQGIGIIFDEFKKRI